MLNAETQGKLSALEAHMATSDKGFETYGVGSQRILPGYTGKVVDIKFEMLDASSGVNPVTRDQVIRIPNAQGVLENLVVASAANKDFPVVLNLIMEDGRRVSVNSIKQSPLSHIGSKQATLMSAKEWYALKGATIKLDSTDDDAATTIRRPNAEGKLEPRAARWFKFLVADAGTPAVDPNATPTT